MRDMVGGPRLPMLATSKRYRLFSKCNTREKSDSLSRRRILPSRRSKMMLLERSPVTTRPRRGHEVDGEAYRFVTREEFAGMVARGELGLPVGVVVNRDGIGDAGVDEYCAEEGIPILMRIPLDRRIAEAISDGQVLIEALPEYRVAFQDLYTQLALLTSGRERAGQ